MKVFNKFANICAEGMKNENNTVSVTGSYSAYCKFNMMYGYNR